MNRQTVAVIFTEGGRFISELIRMRVRKPPPLASEQRLLAMLEKEPKQIEETFNEVGKATSNEGVACLPCVNGHFSVCSGLISDEAIRMARRHGIGDEEISRINKCLDQLNAMEREDLAVDKIQSLPEWEKDLAIYAQNESADIRHKLENIQSVAGLEDVALQIKKARTKIGQEWFKERLSRMSPQEKKKLAEKAMEKLEKEESDVRAE